MEGDSAPRPDSNAVVGGASKYLANLPSRGFFSSTVVSSNPGGVRVYLCDRDTLPPEEQIIKTNQTNILIRSLTLKKQKSDSSSKDIKGKATTESSKAKRTAERTLDSRGAAKKANITTSSGCSWQDGSSAYASEKDFQGLTVDKLRILLKERGLPARGKKDELIARLKGDKVDGET